MDGLAAADESDEFNSVSVGEDLFGVAGARNHVAVEFDRDVARIKFE